MRRGHTFVALVWLMLMVVSEDLAVPPPTDVKVTCQNLKVKVRWTYSGAQSSFTITLKGNTIRGLVEHSEEPEYDLTHHIWASEDSYMGSFYVMVTATVGGVQSEPALSDTFTFSNVGTTALSCQLAFPPVELVRKEQDATLSFSSPFHFYRELKQAVKTDTAVFSVRVTSDYGTKDFFCSVKEETCKRDIVCPEAAECCVTLDGILFAGDLVRQILFKRTHRICAVAAASSLADVRWIVIGVLLGICTFTAVLTVAIIVAKRWSSNTASAFPSATQWPVLRKQASPYFTDSPEATCIVHATPRTTEHSLSSSSCSRQESRTSVGSAHESVHQELAAAEGLSEDEHSDSEVVSSGYNHPHCLVDMGSGDMARAYRE